MRLFFWTGSAGALLASVLAWWLLSEPSPVALGAKAGAQAQTLSSTSRLSAPGYGENDVSSLRDQKPGGAGESAKSSEAFFDPIELAPCTLTPSAGQDVSSQVDGIMDEVLVKIGQQVEKGQLLARLDDRELRAQVGLLSIRATSEASERIAKAQFDEADAKVAYAVKANETGLRSVPELEAKSYLHQRERFAFEIIKAREDREAAQKELEKCKVVLQQHEIRAALTGEIVKIHKRTGEAVKQAEPLLRVANCDFLRVEGLCKIQQANLIRVGMRALVEPEHRGEQITQWVGHTGGITALAVSSGDRLVASASEDRSVILWDWPQGTRRAQLLHPAEVTAVAFLNYRNSGCSLITGCGDGQVYVWHIPTEGTPKRVKAMQQHEGPVRAIAVNAAATRFATGGEDKRIAVWEADTGEHLGWLLGDEGLSAHRGSVTHLCFCPDGRLVSAARDNTVKVWDVAGAAGSVVHVHRGRTSEVSQLGVSPEGRRILMDMGEELRIVDRDGGDFLGSLRSRRQGRFQALAQFSPSGSLVLTASSNMRLQLWSVPPAPRQIHFFRQGYTQGFHRGSLLAYGADRGGWSALAFFACVDKAPRLWDLSGTEVRHFVIPNASTIQAGAFAGDESVFFTGGTDKMVRVWEAPTRSKQRHAYEARITYLGNEIERGTDMVRVRAALENPVNPEHRLRAGMFATLRLYPETAVLK